VLRFLLICAGGAVGTGARYLVALGALRLFGPAFPYGTLTVNVVGSFLIAFLMQLGGAFALPPDLRAVLTTGVLGGFTTYSTFNYETLKYLEEGAWDVALLNLLVTALSCLVAGGLGFWAGRTTLGLFPAT